jgi:6-pyruvoyltetrahydropterin/6-carboxytetrahydropterin synthase
VIVKQQFRFEAAHRLPRHPGKCFNLHGHSYRIELTLELPVNPETGMTMDFSDIEAAVRARVLDRCDHHDLNAFLENPTAENIVVWIWGELASTVPGLRSIELWEVEGCSVVYRGE